MGEVFRGRDPRLGRDVAIKVLSSALATDAERLQRFEQEARAAAALNHPHILAVYDIGQHEGAPYIVSELLEGETLRERLAAGPLTVRKAVEYAIQIVHGLAAAHDKGIVHRDLKPENLFVTAEGRVKILDFGLAKLTQADAALSGATMMPTAVPDTVPGVVLGTIGYMAPEQVRGLVADPRSDIFAFGTVLYEMLTGVKAFSRETTADTMTAILREDLPDSSPVERPILPMLERIIDRCVEKSPPSRFQSAKDLGFALESLSSPSGAAAPAVTDGPPKMRGRLAWTLASMLTAAVAGGLGVWSLRPMPETALYGFEVGPPRDSSFLFAPVAPFQAVSPDGRRMVFTAIRDGQSMIWLHEFSTNEQRPIAGTEGVSPGLAFWSHDSRWVAFAQSGDLMRVDVNGGRPLKVATVQGFEAAAGIATGRFSSAPRRTASSASHTRGGRRAK